MKLIFLASFLIYVGLLDAVPYVDYSLSRRSETTQKPLIGIGGIKSLRRQKADDDEMGILASRSFFAAGFSALGIMTTAALELGNIFFDILGGILGGGVFGSRSYGLNGAEKGDSVKNIQKLRNILDSPRFRNALKLLDSEIERHVNTDENDYDASL